MRKVKEGEARKVKRRECERLQAEKLAKKLATSGGHRRRATKGFVANGVAPTQV